MTNSESPAAPSRARRAKAAESVPEATTDATVPPVAEPVPPAAEPVAPAPAPTTTGAGRVYTLRLPLVTAMVRVPSFSRPRLPHVGRGELTVAAGTVRSLLPPPRKVLFYGGLGALVAFEVIEWPIAAVVAAATMVSEGDRRRERDRGAVPVRTGDTAPAAAPA